MWHLVSNARRKTLTLMEQSDDESDEDMTCSAAEKTEEILAADIEMVDTLQLDNDHIPLPSEEAKEQVLIFIKRFDIVPGILPDEKS